MIADKIKALRATRSLTQTELAKKLGITRSGVNAWEMGISIPSTQYIVELALFFNVSSDYLLDIERSSTISTEGLNEKECSIIIDLVNYMRNKKGA